LATTTPKSTAPSRVPDPLIKKNISKKRGKSREKAQNAATCRKIFAPSCTNCAAAQRQRLRAPQALDCASPLALFSQLTTLARWQYPTEPDGDETTHKKNNSFIRNDA
jgi:hypothetical protein